MKAVCTTYTKTDKGLVLRNNWVEPLMEYDLKEFLMPFTNDLEYLNYHTEHIKRDCKRNGYSYIF